MSRAENAYTFTNVMWGEGDLSRCILRVCVSTKRNWRKKSPSQLRRKDAACVRSVCISVGCLSCHATTVHNSML